MNLEGSIPLLRIESQDSLYLMDALQEHITKKDTIDFDAKILGSTVMDKANFSNYVITGKLDFYGVTFKEHIFFQYTEMYNELKFQDVRFEDALSFFEYYTDCDIMITDSFFSKITLVQSVFERSFSFFNSIIDKSSCFSFVNFNTIQLYDIISNREFSFYDNTFKELTFTKNSFQDFAFEDNTYNGNNGFMYFDNSSFKKAILFRNNVFSEVVSFRDISVIDEINLMYATTKDHFEPVFLNLIGSDVNKFKFIYTQPFYIDQLSSIEYRDELTNVYTVLLKSQQEDGYKNSFIALDKEYKYFSYKNVTGGKLINFFQKHWWGYGHDKYRIITNTFIILIFFWIITFIYLELFLKRATKLKRYN